MDKKTAQNLIEDTFNDSFSEERFTIFAKNLLNDVEPKSNFYTGNLIWDDYKEHINTYKRIGKYIDPEGEALDVLIVEVKSVTKLERARTALRNFVIKHLSKFEKDYALVAFYSKEDGGADWRFSFIKLEYRSELNEAKGKVKLKKEFTPAKRYSFLVGKYEKAHTAKNQLLPLLQNISNNPSIEELEAAFSIEKVTDEFFTQYKDLYIKLYEHFENDNKVKSAIKEAGIDNARFTKKLLGQIVFLYFLQKKGWLGVAQNARWGTGKKRFVQELFEQAQKEKVNFFKDKLQYLFYEALAKERDNINSYYKPFDCRIPFLNGGLFEADYNWQEANITIPENLFRNEEKNKSGDVGTGILDVFDRYNFTIKEDEPLDKEVAVDPEMLGKVFENMLDITERKSKGAFYTPREIVHYMCQESLIHYLDNALNSGTSSYQALDSNQLSLFPGSTNKKGNLKIELEHGNQILVPKEDIELFIREGHFALENDERVASKGETKTYQYQLPESIRKNADLIDKQLNSIKICDPAIGSGAFPVGLLHELVNAMLVLKPHLNYDYLTEKLKGFGFTHRESISDSRYIYRLKRHIIQESIYGVDIDSSAIDIARLRLWLSLVVDEDDLDPIETLPNLDYKIVCGNSLIGLPEGAMRNLEVEDELEKLKEKFYNITDEKEKKALRKQINTKIRELLDSAEQFAGYKIDFDFKLFFSEVWREKGGFDVVIGNPPYLRIQGIRKENPTLADTLIKTFESATGSFDLYVCFTEKGINLTNKSGMLNFIMPVKWTNSSFGIGLRGFIVRNKALQKIISFSSHQVFNASTYTGIQTFQKNCKQFDYTELQKDLPNKTDIQNYLYKLKQRGFSNYELKKLGVEAWVLTSTSDSNVLEKLHKHDSKIKDVFARVFQGIATSKDSVYFLMDCEINNDYITGYSAELQDKVTVEMGFVKPLLKGNQVHRFDNLVTNNYVIFPYSLANGKASLMSEVDIANKFPLGYRYLKDNEVVLRAREKNRFDINGVWFQFSRGQGISNVEVPKLICPEISLGGNVSFDSEGKFYGNTKIYSLVKKGNVQSSYLVWLSILNSSILWYFLKNTGYVLRGGYFTFKTNYLNPFPVPIINNRNSIILDLITRFLLLSIPKEDLARKYFESLIDSIVFELYFPEEIKSAGKEILKHLGDLKPITDDMSEEKKLAIIQSEFERLYDPNHPVRFAIETLDSVEEVRIIKEALK